MLRAAGGLEGRRLGVPMEWAVTRQGALPLCIQQSKVRSRGGGKKKKGKMKIQARKMSPVKKGRRTLEMRCSENRADRCDDDGGVPAFGMVFSPAWSSNGRRRRTLLGFRLAWPGSWLLEGAWRKMWGSSGRCSPLTLPRFVSARPGKTGGREMEEGGMEGRPGCRQAWAGRKRKRHQTARATRPRCEPQRAECTVGDRGSAPPRVLMSSSWLGVACELPITRSTRGAGSHASNPCHSRLDGQGRPRLESVTSAGR